LALLGFPFKRRFALGFGVPSRFFCRFAINLFAKIFSLPFFTLFGF